MRASCLLVVGFSDDKSLEAAYKAVSHEADVSGGRSTIRISKRNRALRLDIRGQDIVALRAAANSCLRALQVFESIEKTEEVQR